jgi:hypothetical protein
VVQAKVGISYVSTADAQLNWKTRNPGWDFDAVRSAAQKSWNGLLGKIKVSGNTYEKTQLFNSLLYKDFIDPNITSDANGQFMWADDKVHTLAAGQSDQYGMYSGWDIYHTTAQLQAMLDGPGAVAGQLLLGGRRLPAVGLPAGQQLRDGRRPRGRHPLGLLPLRRPQVRHRAGAQGHGQGSHHGQRRTTR